MLFCFDEKGHVPSSFSVAACSELLDSDMLLLAGIHASVIIRVIPGCSFYGSPPFGQSSSKFDEGERARRFELSLEQSEVAFTPQRDFRIK